MSVNFTENMEIGMSYLNKQGAFLTTKSDDLMNTMTISWGSIGFAWNKPIFMVLVRKSRFTHEIIEKSKEFTVSIPLTSSMKDVLLFCGTKSGRDLDKFKKCNITITKGKKTSTPIIADCGLYYECKIVFSQDMAEENIADMIKASSYEKGDLHTLYFGEILDCYQS